MAPGTHYRPPPNPPSTRTLAGLPGVRQRVGTLGNRPPSMTWTRTLPPSESTGNQRSTHFRSVAHLK